MTFQNDSLMNITTSCFKCTNQKMDMFVWNLAPWVHNESLGMLFTLLQFILALKYWSPYVIYSLAHFIQCHQSTTRFKRLVGYKISHNTLYTNRLTPNDPYMGRTAPLISKRCILYIYSTNIGTEYFKHALYSPFFALQNAVCFIMLICLVPVLFTFYTQDVLKLKKIIPAPKG